MREVKSITIIPATTSKLNSLDNEFNIKKRVAAYARVSTDNDEQMNSFEAQLDYYTKHIKSNPAWEYVEVYTDEGISATSTKKRVGFNRMISDAISGKIDLILTKSVSRFARNTVDTLTNVRKLKEKGVEVYFEKENIFTFDSKGELFLTILSSLAQEESRSISENVSWGIRKQFADGKVTLPYGNFLGYEKGDDGLPQVVEKEAEIVRMIYRLFLEGRTPSSIATELTEKNIPTPMGRNKWSASTITNILKNEKYIGNAILQKTMTVDFLTKKKKKNTGEIPQYFVENSHTPLIRSEVYELVQEEFQRRKDAGPYTSCMNCFSSRIICGECGGFYGRKVWHAGSKYATNVWHCNNKFAKRKYCSTPSIKESAVKKAFVEAFNSIIENKDEILANANEMAARLTDDNTYKEELIKIETESDQAEKVIKQLISEYARAQIDRQEYNEKYNEYITDYDKIQKRRQELNSAIALCTARKNQMKAFFSELEKQNRLLSEFDETIWYAALNVMKVISDTEVIFIFRDGSELPWHIDCGVRSNGNKKKSN